MLRNHCRNLAAAAIWLTAAIVMGCSTGPEPSQIPIDPTIGLQLREQIEKLSLKDTRERTVAIVTLGAMGSDAAPAIPHLIGVLGDETPVSVRAGFLRSVTITTSPGKEAALALAKIGEESVLPLIKTLAKDDAAVRGNAAMALGIIRDPRAVEPLKQRLWDTDGRVRELSEWALKQIMDKRRRHQPPQQLT